MLGLLTDETIELTNNLEKIYNATTIILPGVGSFDAVMKQLNENKLTSAITELVLKRNVPFLGICVGMQILYSSSDEGDQQGLGWLEGEVKRFSFQNDNNRKFKVPHMGWNTINPSEKLKMARQADERFYFAHSYHVTNTSQNEVLAFTNYGYEFPSIVRKRNIWGFQFHPEKSHTFGKQILQHFLSLR